MKKWREILSSVGLTDSEQKVYLSALEAGESSVQHLAKKTKLSRVTVYSVIETLTQHGLMSSVEKGKKTYYIAEPPERLITYGEELLQKMNINRTTLFPGLQGFAESLSTFLSFKDVVKVLPKDSEYVNNRYRKRWPL